MKQSVCLLFSLLSVSCIHKSGKELSNTRVESSDSAIMYCIADTIVYDVVIRNTNPYDTWIEKSLGKLKRDQFIDSLFDLVYNFNVKAYDYFSGKELTIKQIEALENEDGFDREHIGKIQFTETWFFDKESKTLKKEVISVALGHELYGDSGEFRGYQPVFKLYLNP